MAKNGFSSLHGFSQRSQQSHKAVTVNSEYAACYRHGEIHVRHLARPDEEPQHLRCPQSSRWSKPILELSATWPNILSASIDHVTYIFDLNDSSLRHVLQGIGRTVTSVALSSTNAKVVATGHIDGRICLWNLDSPNRPRRNLLGIEAPCDTLAFCPKDENFLASIHGGRLFVWYLDRVVDRPIRMFEGFHFETFAWQPQTSGRLVASTADGGLRLIDLSDIFKASEAVNSSDGSTGEESDGGIFGRPDDVRGELQPRTKAAIDTRLKSIRWAGNNTLVGLSQSRKEVFVYEAENSSQKPAQLWSYKFQNEVNAVQLLQYDRATTIIGVGDGFISYQDVPETVADRMQSEYRHDVRSATAPLQITKDGAAQASGFVSESQVTEEQTSPNMNPIPISHQRAEASAFERTSRQLQQERRSSRWRIRTKQLTKKDGSSTQAQEPPTRSSTRSPTPDLDLPIFPDEDDVGSPMPFLSPGIPSSRIPSNDAYFLNDGPMMLTQLPESSFESSIPSMADIPPHGQETDDSDDETFIDDMLGSAAFLPGGINVPLPKACGALFAPNGQLLTFFPPKPRQVSTRPEVDEGEPQESRRNGDRETKVFPTFGNLESDFDSFEDSDSNHSLFFNDYERSETQLPRFSFQPASFPSQLSWKSRDTAAQPPLYDQHEPYHIIVSIHEITDVPALHPVQRDVAKEYRLLCRAGESGFELCEHNAKVAENVRLLEVAEVWRLLAMLLEDQVPLELHSLNSSDDILIIAQRARQLMHDDAGVDSDGSAKTHNLFGKLRWASHAFGRLWLVRRTLDWAEQRADVQSLACFSAVLSNVTVNFPIKNATAEQCMLRHLPTYSPDYFADATARTSSPAIKRAIPVLRTHAATVTSLNEFPTKLLRETHLSSRNPSQASTPYLDSDSTPPFPSPLLSRQSTRLSTSGSASPEFQRGSFSAAAKYYAQSITEKFASYGTSPPVKKASTSPTANTELSTSLPSGSWPGKSVSFASSTTNDTTRSFSVSASKARYEEDDYDSDKTIEDTSGPHTPKSPGNVVVLNFNNQDIFADEISGSSKTKLIPDDLAEKSTMWNQYYGELLRSWGMLGQANELEKVGGLATGMPLQLSFADMDNVTMLPTAVATQRRIVCDICLTATKGIIQTCPSCLHSSHLHCLEEFSTYLSGGEFTCPSGCGCLCADLPLAMHDIPSQSPPQRPTFKKKASFTDPRRWRARVEGDSW